MSDNKDDTLVSDAPKDNVVTLERDAKGRFKKGAASPNAKGRPKGAKSRHSKAKLETMLNSYGFEAWREVIKIARKMQEAGDLEKAFRMYFAIAEKHYMLTLHNDRVEIAEQREKKKLKAQQDDEEDQQVVYQNVVFTGTLS